MSVERVGLIWFLILFLLLGSVVLVKSLNSSEPPNHKFHRVDTCSVFLRSENQIKQWFSKWGPLTSSIGGSRDLLEVRMSDPIPGQLNPVL